MNLKLEIGTLLADTTSAIHITANQTLNISSIHTLKSSIYSYPNSTVYFYPHISVVNVTLTLGGTVFGVNNITAHGTTSVVLGLTTTLDNLHLMGSSSVTVNSVYSIIYGANNVIG